MFDGFQECVQQVVEQKRGCFHGSTGGPDQTQELLLVAPTAQD